MLYMVDMNDKVAFLKKIKPFDLLPPEVLQEAAEMVQEVRPRGESVLYLQDATKLQGLDIIVKGQYEIFFYDSESNKRLKETLESGQIYGGISILLNRRRSIRTVVPSKGTVVYTLPRKAFRSLCYAYEPFFQYFTAEYGRKIINDEYAHFVRQSLPVNNNLISADQFFSKRITSIVPRKVYTCSPQTPIHEVAHLMATNKASCVFVEENGEILGYVTDMTLRDNIVSKRVSLDEPIEKYMDNPIVRIASDAYVYEAILLMFSTRTRYLLIEDSGKITGLLSRNKLLTDQAQSPFVFIQSVRLSTSTQELKKKWDRMPGLIYQLLDRGVKAEIVNQIITATSDTIAQKVIEGVINEIGNPPAKFAFMVLGSEGRKEQSLKTDQDNAIIYEDKANEQRELVRAYFLRFAEMVSERLDTIGFSFCTGGFMAKNPKWTHSLSHWKNNYKQWIDRPEPEAVMKVATFFDCRHIYGEKSLIEELKAYIGERLKAPTGMFLYNLAVNALQYEPPLTFFNNFRTFTKGSQRVFDLKKTMTPIVDLVRIYALKHLVFRTNTGARIQELYALKVFNEKEYNELMQSYYYLMGMRLKMQSEHIIRDKNKPHNYIDPSKLTKIERATLKQIFKIIENFQLRIKIEFTKSLR